MLNHAHIGRAVANGQHLRHADAHFLHQHAHGIALAHLIAHNLQIIWIAVDGVHHTAQVALQVVVHSLEQFLVVAHQHQFTGPLVHVGGYHVVLPERHSVHGSLVLHVRIGDVGADYLTGIVIGQHKARALGNLLDMGHHLRIDTAFEEYIAALGLRTQGTVVRNDVALVFIEFQGLCNGHQGMGGPAGGQCHPHTQLLYLDECSYRTLAQFSLAVEDGSIHIQHQ